MRLGGSLLREDDVDLGKGVREGKRLVAGRGDDAGELWHGPVPGLGVPGLESVSEERRFGSAA